MTFYNRNGQLLHEALAEYFHVADVVKVAKAHYSRKNQGEKYLGSEVSAIRHTKACAFTTDHVGKAGGWGFPMKEIDFPFYKQNQCSFV